MARVVFAALFLALAIGARAAPGPKSVAEAVIANKDDGLGVLLAAVQAADPAILEALSDEGLVATIFAPTDKAFKKLLKALDLTAEELLKDKKLVTSVLKYHVVPSAAIPAKALKRTQVVQTLLEGKTGKLRVNKSKAGVRLFTTSGGTSKVLTPDVKVGKAIIHIVDRVLIPGKKSLTPKARRSGPKHH